MINDKEAKKTALQNIAHRGQEEECKDRGIWYKPWEADAIR